LPFLDFPFKLAADAQVPVVPVAIVSDVPFMPKGTHAVDPDRGARFRIRVLDPIPWRPGTKAGDLSWETRRKLQKAIAELEPPRG
jgi:1-acyl-sn-glycerol-3-phosphate acyltransferase